MGQTLSKPPLIEALCEFKFAEDSPWDWTIPGRLYERIKAEYPEHAEVKGLTVQLGGGGQEAAMEPLAEQGPERIQMKKSNGSAMVQVGSRLLAVNQLRPYEGWDGFLHRIMEALARHREVAGEAIFRRIGLRYINHLPLQEGREVGSEMITVAPPLEGKLRGRLRNFYQRYEIEQESPKGVLIHQTGTPGTQSGDVIALDLDFGSNEVGDVSGAESTRNWLNLAHDLLHDAFVNSLTPGFYATLK